MNPEDAERRLGIFERGHGSPLVQLASHAALPVVLNPDFVHLLRVNFFLDPPVTLPYAAEAELLLSPLCTEVDQGLYVIDPDLRDLLLQHLIEEYGSSRLRDVARLLWEYGQRSTPWLDRPGLSEAQQLTVLNIIDPARARDWLAHAEESPDAGTAVSERWFVAMRQDLEGRAAAVQRAREQAGTEPDMLPALMALRDVLANHYHKSEALAIASRVGLRVADLDVTGPSVALWQQILSAAWSSNRLPALFEAAVPAAGTAAWLDGAVQEYWIRLSPALRVEDGRLQTPPPEWQVLEQHREQIERTLRGLCVVTRRESDPRFRYGATGFLAWQSVVLTHESMVEQFRPPSTAGSGTPGQTQDAGVDVWLAFADQHSTVPSVPASESASGDTPIEGLVPARVTGVTLVGQNGVAALTLEVAPEDLAAMPLPLPMATVPPPDPVGRQVYVLGYPSLSDSRTDPAVVARVFGEASDVLRVQPGEIVSVDLTQATDTGLITHNCFTLGGNGGSPLVDLATGQVLGLHFAATYDPGPHGLKSGRAAALWSYVHERVRTLGEEALRARPGSASSASPPASVFISYSHQDVRFLELLMVHLRVLERQDPGPIQIFTDQGISPGESWWEQIQSEISKAAVVILLVTPDYLASSFLMQGELPQILAHAEDDGAVILPLLVKPSTFDIVPGLSRFQVLNPTHKTLAEMRPAERDRFLTSVAETVEQVVRRRRERPSPADNENREPIQVVSEEDAPSSRSAPVISLEQPEQPEQPMQDLTLNRAATVGHSGLEDLEPPPLAGRISVAFPHSKLISAEDVAADPDLRAFIDDESRLYRFHLAQLAISFAERPVTPRLNSATVALNLVSSPATPGPVVLSMTPTQAADVVLVQREIRIGPKLSILGPGESIKESSSQTGGGSLHAMGVGTAQPTWEFSRTASRELAGSYRLAMIVRVGADSVTSISGVVTATTRGSVRTLFRAELATVLTIQAAL